MVSFLRIPGHPAYDADGRTLRVPVVLDPGREYRIGLNSEEHRSFASEEGRPLRPTAYRFRTR